MKKTNTNSISSILTILSSDLKKVDKIIIDNCKAEAELISDIANHLILSGGKRIRPILTILSARICNYDTKQEHHFKLAAAVELIHSATLLHDDVVDSGTLRRGKETANIIWGNKASILVGDYLLSTAFQLMVKTGSIGVLDLLSQSSRIMSDGEVKQLVSSSDIKISRKKYLEIVSQKTAILFAAATGSGAIISNCKKEFQDNLYSFGMNIGIAFQIIDDVLDYKSSSNDLGKEIGDDFMEGKVTLPIIIALEKANINEKSKIEEIFHSNSIKSDKKQIFFKEILNILNKHKVFDIATEEANSYYKKALVNLETFSDCFEKSALLEIAKYALTRDS